MCDELMMKLLAIGGWMEHDSMVDLGPKYWQHNLMISVRYDRRLLIFYCQILDTLLVSCWPHLVTIATWFHSNESPISPAFNIPDGWFGPMMTTWFMFVWGRLVIASLLLIGLTWRHESSWHHGMLPRFPENETFQNLTFPSWNTTSSTSLALNLMSMGFAHWGPQGQRPARAGWPGLWPNDLWLPRTSLGLTSSYAISYELSPLGP